MTPSDVKKKKKKPPQEKAKAEGLERREKRKQKIDSPKRHTRKHKLRLHLNNLQCIKTHLFTLQTVKNAADKQFLWGKIVMKIM